MVPIEMSIDLAREADVLTGMAVKYTLLWEMLDYPWEDGRIE